MKLKQSLIDSARILGFDTNEAMAVTKTLNDEVMKELDSIDDICAESALLKDYRSKYPTVVDLAWRLSGKIKSQGQHAAGVIISGVRLDDIVPMSYIGDKWVSQWIEGMAATQLSKFGLVKFDILGLKTMSYIVYTEELLLKHHGVKIDWNTSDIRCAEPYIGYEILSDGTKNKILLNDSAALGLANTVKTDGVFQFDTPIAKKYLSDSGVKSFNDLTVLNAMGHPGPIENIPEFIRRRDDPKQLWKKKEDPRVIDLLGSTFGIICVHEDTNISMANGLEVKIKDINIGDKVFSVSENDRLINSNMVSNKVKTKFGLGMRLTLNNGCNAIFTPDHKVLTNYGYKEIQNLNENDVVAIAHESSWEGNKKKLAPWLGDDKDIAFFIGLLVGDGCLTASSYNIAVGSKDDAMKILEFMRNKLNLNVRMYFNVRCWYVAFYLNQKIDFKINNNDFANFIDNYDWWFKILNKYSISEIADSLKRSTWYVDHRIKKFNIKKPIINRSKTKLHNWIDSIKLNKNFYNKRIPECIMLGSENIRAHFLAGLIDSDGCIYKTKRNIVTIHITSVSNGLINDIRKILNGFGLHYKIYKNRIYIWNVKKLKRLIKDKLVIKQMPDGALCDGSNLCEYPSSAINNVEFKKLRKMGFHKSTIYLGDLQFYSVKSIEKVENCQFYDITVENDHSMICNGIVAHNCYQEQLTAAWMKFGGLTAPEAEKARKAVAKKKADEVTKVNKKVLEGMLKRNFDKQYAEDFISKLETFGRYAFNLSHALCYSMVAYRSLWLKAHYPIEFWASILTFCDQEEIPKYIGVAKNEGIEFGSIKVGHLYEKVAIVNGCIIPSLAMIKGIGSSASASYSKDGGICVSLDDFITKYEKSKAVLERLIKLGAFDDIHGNRKALWNWYQYKYCGTDEEVKKLRELIDSKIMELEWPNKKILDERKRQGDGFKTLYPKRKIPDKINNWKPKIGYRYDKPTIDDVLKLFSDDRYTYSEVLAFEKEFFGVYWSNPMALFKCYPSNTFSTCRVEGTSYIDGIVEKWVDGRTKTDKPYRSYFINDGFETNPVRIWGETVKYQDEIVYKIGTGVRLSAQWNEKYMSFNLARNTSIITLQRQKCS